MSEYNVNEHGVKGHYGSQNVFIPECCLKCGNYGWEPTQDGWGVTYYYCKLNIKFPTKKGTCKKQNPIRRFGDE